MQALLERSVEEARCCGGRHGVKMSSIAVTAIQSRNASEYCVAPPSTPEYAWELLGGYVAIHDDVPGFPGFLDVKRPKQTKQITNTANIRYSEKT